MIPPLSEVEGMWCAIVCQQKKGVTCFEARVYRGKDIAYLYECMSEGGARSWLAAQGIPFNKQPRFITIIRKGV